MCTRPPLEASLRAALVRSLAGRIEVIEAGAVWSMLTPSMRIALADLALDALHVVYPGERRYRLAEPVEAVPLGSLLPREKAASTA